MARPSPQSIASHLPSLSSPDTRLAALKALKNELIGHEEKKKLWVRSGVLRPLADVLNSEKGTDGNPSRRHQPRNEQEEARLQAIIVVGSIAQGQYLTAFACRPCAWRLYLLLSWLEATASGRFCIKMGCQSADLLSRTSSEFSGHRANSHSRSLVELSGLENLRSLNSLCARLRGSSFYF